jgi:dTDP-glucose 4,6-dehydratase
VHADICDADDVARSMDGHDAVVHFAAESHVDRSIEDGSKFVRTNCMGTNVLCDVANTVGIGKFLHISTDEVYGSVEEGSSVETDVLAPRSPYSAAKAGSDLIALSYFSTYGLPVVVTRCSNNYGPYQFPEKVIPLFTTNLLDGKQVPLYGDGLNVRDWIHVEDHNIAAHLVLEQGAPGRDLQHRRRQRGHQRRPDPPPAGADRTRRVVHPTGRGPARARSSLLGRHRQGQRTRLVALAIVRRLARRHRRLVPRATATGGNR